jgi:hypothetical protein
MLKTPSVCLRHFTAQPFRTSASHMLLRALHASSAVSTVSSRTGPRARYDGILRDGTLSSGDATQAAATDALQTLYDPSDRAAKPPARCGNFNNTRCSFDRLICTPREAPDSPSAVPRGVCVPPPLPSAPDLYSLPNRLTTRALQFYARTTGAINAVHAICFCKIFQGRGKTVLMDMFHSCVSASGVKAHREHSHRCPVLQH